MVSCVDRLQILLEEVSILKSKFDKVVLDKPNVNLEFFTTSILGLINESDWLAPPVFAEIDTILTGVRFKSDKVSVNWKYLSLILLMKKLQTATFLKLGLERVL